MNNLLFNPNVIWNKGFSIVRIATGLFMMYHGTEIFNAESMAGAAKWLTELGFPMPDVMAYLGKGSEFVSGLCLALGLFTRIASVMLAITMTTITFGMGHGKIFTDDQHPFMFVLLALIFFFSGPGAWSLDSWIFNRTKKQVMTNRP